MSDDLVVKRDAFASAFDPANMTEAGKMANWLAKSNLIPDALKGKPSDCLVVLITGRELGLSAMQSLRMISVIRGKSVMDASLIVALVVARKDVCQYFTITETTNESATYTTHRVGAPEPASMTFTMEDAALAGLASKDNYKKHPAAMLRARCSSALARAIYPDLVANIYSTDEGEELARGMVNVTRPEAAEPLVPEVPMALVDPEPEPTPGVPEHLPADQAAALADVIAGPAKAPPSPKKRATARVGDRFYEAENRNPTSPHHNGECISPKQVGFFKQRCRERAKLYDGVSGHDIEQAILDAYRVQSAELIRKPVFNKYYRDIADDWTPPVGEGDALKRGADKVLTETLKASVAKEDGPERRPVDREDGPPEGMFPPDEA